MTFFDFDGSFTLTNGTHYFIASHATGVVANAVYVQSRRPPRPASGSTSSIFRWSVVYRWNFKRLRFSTSTRGDDAHHQPPHRGHRHLHPRQGLHGRAGRRPRLGSEHPGAHRGLRRAATPMSSPPCTAQHVCAWSVIRRQRSVLRSSRVLSPRLRCWQRSHDGAVVRAHRNIRCGWEAGWCAAGYLEQHQRFDDQDHCCVVRLRIQWHRPHSGNSVLHRSFSTNTVTSVCLSEQTSTRRLIPETTRTTTRDTHLAWPVRF